TGLCAIEGSVDPRAHYEEGAKARAREVEALEGRSRTIGSVRLLLVAIALGSLAAIAWAHLQMVAVAWAVLAASIIGFIALVVLHGRVIRQKDRRAAAMRFHERGLARLDGTWQKLPFASEIKAAPNHPYVGDLDIVGHGSLFHFIDRTETRFGRVHLASWLGGGVGTFPEDVSARQEAVREIAKQTGFREELYSLGAVLGDDKPDPAQMIAWAEGQNALVVSPLLPVLAKILPVLTVAAIAFHSHLPRGVWLGLLIIQLVVVAPLRKGVKLVLQAASTREGALSAYGEMLTAIENAKLKSPLLSSLRKRTEGATVAMAELARILAFVDARHNEVFRLFINPVLLWEPNSAFALEAWRKRHGSKVRGWVEALGEVEALSSLGALAFEQPAFAWPTFSTDTKFSAKGLGHPLIPSDKRVANDIALGGADPHALIVTGSNMSGKSTLLRAIGVNAALALAGAPVCAESMEMGDVRVVTSMRISDSLESGISHFYAELQKLKLVIGLSRGQRKALFLLDEILHGTNTRERLIGARAVARELVAAGAIGAISTHDIAIGDLEQELPGKVRNVHFEEQVENDQMTFDYKLRDGLVQSSNALRLMKIVGLPT
ncbi:MAG: MutS-related protein, partial [Polyangiaceae bacterium]